MEFIFDGAQENRIICLKNAGFVLDFSFMSLQRWFFWTAIGSFLFLTGTFQIGNSFGQHSDQELAKQAWLKRVRHSYLVTDLSNALRDEEFADEWMLSGEQKRELTAALDVHQQELRRLIHESSRQVQSLELEGYTNKEISGILLERQRVLRAKGVVEESEVDGDELWIKAESILLPHQFARLKQVILQRELAAEFGGDRLAMVLALVDRLELTDEEKEKLEQKVAEVQADYRERHKKLQVEFVRRLFESLPERTREWMKLPDEDLSEKASPEKTNSGQKKTGQNSAASDGENSPDNSGRAKGGGF